MARSPQSRYCSHRPAVFGVGCGLCGCQDPLKSAGKGFALLNSLGAAFSILDYCWQQLPDGVIYVGSYNDSRFAQAQVDIPTTLLNPTVAATA